MPNYSIGLVDFNYGPGAVDKARDFYRQAFGWEPIFEDDNHYHVLRSANGTCLGLQQIAEGTNYLAGGAEFYEIGKPMVLIDTDDIDDSLKKLAALGCTIKLDKDEMPGIGWWAILDDPFGARFALRQLTIPIP
ncbi:VOC family protein [Nocardia sp. NPDC052566]|uniref:VOC family protein n=1 Tax=Nocardia sp. NPDC052566 TaxID=3364330 RepID=UPI0037C66156